MFRIASFAELAGVSPKVLRDYDRRGLFRPAWVDPESSYRLYSPAQLPELRRILGLRDLGVGLTEIYRLVTARADLRGTLEHRRATLEAERRELDRRLASLGITLAAGGSSVPLPDIVVRSLRAELVATLDVARVRGHDVGRAFYELELAVRDAGVRAPRPPGALVGTGDEERDRSVVFVPIRRGAPGIASRRLPACRAATALHRGSYGALPRTWRALDDWISAAGLRPLEPARVLYLQFGAEADLHLPARYLVEDDERYLTEIQVPLG